jgi:repressor LexA
MFELTSKQKDLLDAIQVHVAERGVMPSYREIAAALGASSPATVHKHVTLLEKKGYVIRHDGGRSMALTPKATMRRPAIGLPLKGLITAGAPIEAIETNESIDVPADMVVDEINSYVLKVKGESMIDDGILDGDYVIVERNPSPRNGDIVVALLENTYATLKRFYRETNRIRLQPANSTMSPIYAQDPLIQGVVRAVLRKYSTA